MRLELIKSATINVKNLEFIIPFNELNKEAEFNVLLKSILPPHKSNNNTNKA